MDAYDKYRDKQTRLNHHGFKMPEPVMSQAPDPEVVEKAKRRKFSAAYKLQVLREADRCDVGELGALLRREGLYSSHLSTWRRQRQAGELEGLSPKPRGVKPKAVDPALKRVAELERENQRLQQQLKQAQTIIEMQKKLSDLLGIPLGHSEPDA